VLSNITLSRCKHSLFIYSSTEGHPGYFQLLAVMNKADIIICVQVFAWQSRVFILYGNQGFLFCDLHYVLFSVVFHFFPLAHGLSKSVFIYLFSF